MEEVSSIIPDVINDKTMSILIEDAFNSRGKEKSLKFAIIEKIIREDLFSVNDCLVLAINKLAVFGDLGLIVICLNNKASPNMYINTPKGDMHVLIYGIDTIPENLWTLFIYIMMLSNSNPKKQCFLVSSKAKLETVEAWLIKYKELEIPETSTECLSTIVNLSIEEQIFINVAYDLLPEYPKDSLAIMCCCRVALFNKIKNPGNSDVYLKIAFECVFKELFIQMLNKGLRPDYLDISCFISFLSVMSKKKHSKYICNDLNSMLNELIRRGVIFDTYQFSEIAFIDPVFHVVALKEYKIPLWEKICYSEVDDFVPKELREKYLFLGGSFGDNKQKMKSLFKSIMSSSLGKMADTFRERNIKRLSLNIASITEPLQENIHIENIDKIDNDPFDYPTQLIAFYKDQDDKIWCFLSTSFENIERNGINPYNKKELMQDFIVEIKSKVELFSAFAINGNLCITIKELLDDLKKDEEIVSGKESDDYILRYQKELSSKGYSQNNVMNTQIEILRSRLIDIGIYLEEYIYIADYTKLRDVPLSDKFKYIIIIRAICKKVDGDITIFEKLKRL